MTIVQALKSKPGRKFLFFGGKGGVGKTTMAAATAVWVADQGFDTTIVSTDPTVSLPSVFHQPISATEKTPIAAVKNLSAVNINPSEASGVFQGRLSKTLSGLADTIGGDLISVPCAEEMAAFDQFVAFLDDPSSEVVVFDTAPTGHSLRELSMPFDWADFMKKQVQDRKELAVLLKLGEQESAVAQLEQERERYNSAIAVLRDPERTYYTLVLLPAYLPIMETSSALKDLATLGIDPCGFIVNQLIPKEAVQGNQFLAARYAVQTKYMSDIQQRFGHSAIATLELLESDVHDVQTLRHVAHHLYGRHEPARKHAADVAAVS